MKLTKKQALRAVINMAKRVQLDHTYKGCRFNNTYLRQKKAMEIVENDILNKYSIKCPKCKSKRITIDFCHCGQKFND
jgi:hypothetical protein